MSDLIDREEAIDAINGLCLGGEGAQQIWSSDAVDAIKALRPRIKSPETDAHKTWNATIEEEMQNKQ